MKEQYVGDVSDYRKYALLRRLQAQSGLRFGVCWMLTPSDGSRDGSKTAYLDQPQQRRHDPEVFEVLRAVRDAPDGQRLTYIEDSGIIPGAIYDNAMVPDALTARESWFARSPKPVADAELVFFDPDNGIDVPSKRKGLKGSSKYLYRDEVAATYAAHRSLLIYQHHPHKPLAAFYSDLVRDLRLQAPDADVWTFRTPHVAFILLIHPDHQVALHAAARPMSDNFDGKFLATAHHPMA